MHDVLERSWASQETATDEERLPSISTPTFSVLFLNSKDAPNDDTEAPACFRDLNLDRVIEAVIAGHEEYRLAPFFHRPLHDPDAVRYRYEVMQDLEVGRCFEIFTAFGKALHEVRNRIANATKSRYREQADGLFLEAIELYCDSVTICQSALDEACPQSRGLRMFLQFLKRYLSSAEFRVIQAHAQALRQSLSAVRYSILIADAGFTVNHYRNEPDYSKEVEDVFERFKQGSVKSYLIQYSETREMDHIEAQALEFVAQLNPDLFSDLASFVRENREFQDPTILRFDREIQFYLAYLRHLAKFKEAGLPFCYAAISTNDWQIHSSDSFDLALANKLLGNTEIVRNDFYLKGSERTFVVTGPNQGGKTTFARSFGQLHYLASIGCCIPGREARLFLPDRIFTHFEKEEDIHDLRGKLHDDLVRIHAILAEATAHSVLIMNEIFTSTTVQDATMLSDRIMGKIVKLGALTVWVTFIDEVSEYGPQTVSMMSTIVPNDPSCRTFKVIRKRADGLSYALSIAEKYRVTYSSLKTRVSA